MGETGVQSQVPTTAQNETFLEPYQDNIEELKWIGSGITVTISPEIASSG